MNRQDWLGQKRPTDGTLWVQDYSRKAVRIACIRCPVPSIAGARVWRNVSGRRRGCLRCWTPWRPTAPSVGCGSSVLPCGARFPNLVAKVKDSLGDPQPRAGGPHMFLLL
jgi:hypothetical protein